MKDYQIRVINEENELSAKLKKLDAFFLTDTYKNLAQNEKDLLLHQYAAMNDYDAALNARIKLFQ